MTKNRTRYSEEFKREAVSLMETSGKPVAQIARDLGINANNLYRWRGVYGSDPHLSSNGSSAGKGALEAELKRLKHENAVLRQERDVLKKAMHIVSRSQP
jgi:transposase